MAQFVVARESAGGLFIPAVLCAAVAMAASSSVFTGPRRVTTPSTVMIFVFFAFIESPSCAMTALRICWVM